MRRLRCWYIPCQCHCLLHCTAVALDLFYLFSIQLTVYDGTITRFIADNKVVYQRVRWEMRLASDNSWARRRLKHLSWRSRWVILCTLEQRIAVYAKSHELIGAFLACPPDWAQGPPLLCNERGLPLPACRTVVPVVWILLRRMSMLPTFQPLSGNSLSIFCAPYRFDG